MRKLVIGLVVVSHQVYALNANACGATGYMLAPLLPLPDADGVPLDAALISSSNLTDAVLQLRKISANGAPVPEAPAPTEADDAGAGSSDLDVELTTECHRAFEGAVCVARPTSLLEPATTYEWSAAMVAPSGLEEGYLEPSPWQRFTTSDRTHDDSATPSIDVAVLTHDRYTNPPCGIDHAATLEFDAVEIDGPVVVNITGLTPSYVMQAVALTPDDPVEMLLYSAPDCVTPEVFDVTGARTALPELCIDALLPATTYDENGQPLVDSEPVVDSEAPHDPQAPRDDGAIPVDDGYGITTPPDQDHPNDDVPSDDMPSDEAADDGIATEGIDDESARAASCTTTHASQASTSVYGLALALFGFRRRRRSRTTCTEARPPKTLPPFPPSCDPPAGRRAMG